MPGWGLLAVALALLSSLLVTAMVLARAKQIGLLAVPNQRSSHARPTPTGGGLGIVAGSLVGGAVLLAGGWDPSLILVLASSVPVAVVGLFDDIRPVPARWRLLVQILCFAVVVALTLPPMHLLDSWFALPVVAVLVITAVYWINIYNFMDGIDGLAGMQGSFMCTAAVVIAWLGEPSALQQTPVLLLLSPAAACLGFLAFNWPPARIFMGDVGSTFVAFLIVALALHTIASALLSPASWVILSGAFLIDATITLARRLAFRERIWVAHRRHAYQFLARRFGAHRPVTLLYLAINITWLLPMALWAQLQPACAWWAAVLGLAPLAALAAWAGAGRPE